MIIEVDDVDVFLEHHGVKGQKWGIRNRSKLHSLNKASRKRDKAKRDRQIEAARTRYKTSARSNYKEAKAQYKIDKYVIGKREAKKALNKVKAKNFKDYNTASQAKSGKETTKAVLATVGLAAVLTAAQIAASRA